MAGVNTAGTYRLTGAALTIDTGGTPIELQIAAKTVAITATPNFASHPRTGGGAGYEEYIDANYELEFSYAHGFGTDGVFEVFEALAGTEVDWLLETSDGVVSDTYPTFSFTAKVPMLSPLPSTDWGEFAQGDITIPIKGEPVKATA